VRNLLGHEPSLPASGMPQTSVMPPPVRPDGAAFDWASEVRQPLLGCFGEVRASLTARDRHENEEGAAGDGTNDAHGE
jgi:hypothetical protein